MPYTRRAAPAILKLLLTKANVYKVDAGVSQIFWIYSVHKFWTWVHLSCNHTLIGTASHGVVKNEWQFAESDFECYLQVCVWNNLEMKKTKHRPILKASPILGKKDRTLILAADSITNTCISNDATNCADIVSNFHCNWNTQKLCHLEKFSNLVRSVGLD